MCGVSRPIKFEDKKAAPAVGLGFPPFGARRRHAATWDTPWVCRAAGWVGNGEALIVLP